MEPLSKELFDVLACPVCKGSLKYTAKKDGLSCAKCKVVYNIEDGIPNLLPKK
jgi:uncharacterized protein